MTSDPDKAASQADIKNLLNLLNASEEVSAASELHTATMDEPKLDERLTSLRRLANGSNPLSAGDPDATPDHVENLSQDHCDNEVPPDDTENRFAAHIVYGMSKLKPK